LLSKSPSQIKKKKLLCETTDTCLPATGRVFQWQEMSIKEETGLDTSLKSKNNFIFLFSLYVDTSSIWENLGGRWLPAASRCRPSPASVEPILSQPGERWH
jgi:hypothetical protein